jgi:NTE family protein
MYLVVGSGGMSFFSFLGSAAYIGFDKIEEVSGCSAGAILGLFICTGKTIDEIIEFCFETDLKELAKINMISLITKFGLISHEPIKKILVKFCGNPTFKELKKKLHVTSFCVNRSETEYFSADNHPDMFVIDAVCMSMSIPFLFETITHNTFTYIDGATRESVPVMAFMDKEPDKIIIIKNEENKAHVSEIKNISQFIQSMVRVVIQNANSLSHKTGSKTISINTGDTNVFDFSMSFEDKMKLYIHGYQTALTHLGSFK